MTIWPVPGVLPGPNVSSPPWLGSVNISGDSAPPEVFSSVPA